MVYNLTILIQIGILEVQPICRHTRLSSWPRITYYARDYPMIADDTPVIVGDIWLVDKSTDFWYKYVLKMYR